MPQNPLFAQVCWFIALNAHRLTYSSAGLLLCRFETGTTEVRELGRYLKGRQARDFQPHFLIRDGGDKSESRVCIHSL
jgi:hypothetical protein